MTGLGKLFMKALVCGIFQPPLSKNSKVKHHDKGLLVSRPQPKSTVLPSFCDELLSHVQSPHRSEPVASIPASTTLWLVVQGSTQFE